MVTEKSVVSIVAQDHEGTDDGLTVGFGTGGSQNDEDADPFNEVDDCDGEALENGRDGMFDADVLVD